MSYITVISIAFFTNCTTCALALDLGAIQYLVLGDMCVGSVS